MRRAGAARPRGRDRGTPQTMEALLRDPASYPVPSAGVEVVETHMSWVFLLTADVFKLKKAVRLDGLDFSTPERRRRNCVEEVRLNRRLAPGVYRGVVPVMRRHDGTLAVGGAGDPVDWLVHMRRLPAHDHLGAVLGGRSPNERLPAVRSAARHLADFYAAARPEAISGAAYHARLVSGTCADHRVLVQPRYQLAAETVDAVIAAQLAVLDEDAAVFTARAEHHRIVEGHGDLRPEHVWLTEPPVVIDCIEFDRRLRTVDPYDDLAFLALECERLGHPAIGRVFLETYEATAGDPAPAGLLAFYRRYRALRRATLAVRHLDDPDVADPSRHLETARHYLRLAGPARS